MSKNPTTGRHLTPSEQRIMDGAFLRRSVAIVGDQNTPKTLVEACAQIRRLRAELVAANADIAMLIQKETDAVNDE